MPPYGPCPDPSDTDESIYARYLDEYSLAFRDSLKQQASNELDAILIQEYGSDDYANAVSEWQSNPLALLLIDPNYGLSHAAELLLTLQALNLTGSTNAQIQTRADEEIAEYYATEARVRCTGTSLYPAVDEWLNPSEWNEDSRLDYFSPLLFSEWYISNL